MRRAVETARLITEEIDPALPVVTLRALRAISDRHPDDRLGPPSRLEAFLKSLTGAPADGLPMICVCHANVIRYVLVSLGGLSRDEWEDLELEYCSISGLDISREKQDRILFCGRTVPLTTGPDDR